MINIHTLGPAKGTNCEKAAYYWLNKNNQQGKYYSSPYIRNRSKKEMEVSQNSILLGCIVYPFYTILFLIISLLSN